MHLAEDRISLLNEQLLAFQDWLLHEVGYLVSWIQWITELSRLLIRVFKQIIYDF
jgi:hypothetical protein